MSNRVSIVKADKSYARTWITFRALLLLAVPSLAACSAVLRTPEDLRSSQPAQSYQFTVDRQTVVECLLPHLDRIEPFNLGAGATRPPTVRNLKSDTQILAMDETIALYVIDVKEMMPIGTQASAYVNQSFGKRIDPKIHAAMRACGGN
ncbi:MAG TPA: hypothetical protein VLA52_04690 [Thermohalobaculum sp.]|nr:hypothetical protein [Thermohalobaculum sp.]